MKFKYDKAGELWHGFKFWKSMPWYDCGLFALDYSEVTKEWNLYIWKFTITF